MSNRSVALKVAILLCLAPLAHTPSMHASATFNEPAMFPLSGLFSFADKVAVVKILSGTTEAYDVTVYKGQVVEAFKGAAAGEVVYFGPFIGMKVGTEYVLFLKDQAEPMQPKDKASGYGAVRYSYVFDEGYSSMPVSYECVFEGREPSQQCDYAVRVCTDYIRLPKSLPTAPPDDTNAPFGCRWVKRELFISELGRMAKQHEVVVVGASAQEGVVTINAELENAHIQLDCFLSDTNCRIPKTGRYFASESSQDDVPNKDCFNIDLYERLDDGKRGQLAGTFCMLGDDATSEFPTYPKH